MIKDEPKGQYSQDGLRIFDFLNEIFIQYNPYDEPDKYVKECKKQFAGIENDKNIESIKDDLFIRWKNGQIDLLNVQGAAPDRNNIIPFLKKGVFVITDYVYLFNKMKYS